MTIQIVCTSARDPHMRRPSTSSICLMGLNHGHSAHYCRVPALRLEAISQFTFRASSPRPYRSSRISPSNRPVWYGLYVYTSKQMILLTHDAVSMCLISWRASRFIPHNAANLSMEPPRRQMAGNDSHKQVEIVCTRRYELFHSRLSLHIQRVIPLSTYLLEAD